MLSIAKGLLEEEEKEQEEERGRYMAENCPPLSLPRTMQELQVRPEPVQLHSRAEDKRMWLQKIMSAEHSEQNNVFSAFSSTVHDFGTV